MNVSGKSSGDSKESSPDVSLPPVPPASGFSVGKQMKPPSTTDTQTTGKKMGKDKSHKPRIKPNRMKVISDMPSEDKLAAIKYKKKVSFVAVIFLVNYKKIIIVTSYCFIFFFS